LHSGGPLGGRRLLAMGASGGDMAMTADVSRDLQLVFPPIAAAPRARLFDILGERVTISNPFDFHTYTWFDPPRQRAVFDTAVSMNVDAVAFVLDCPPEQKADLSAFTVVIDEYLAAAQMAREAASAAQPRTDGPAGPARVALLASLPETMPASIREQCLNAGVVPLQGLREGLEALDLCGAMGECWRHGSRVTMLRPAAAALAAAAGGKTARNLLEREAKQALAAFGVPIPASRQVSIDAAVATARDIGFPVVMKAAAATLAHKSDVGGVILNIRDAAAAEAAAAQLGQLADQVLVEAMVSDGVVEILVGMLVDAQFGLTLVVGSGGVLTELVRDSITLLPPFTRESISSGLQRLAAHKLMAGYRGKPAGDVPALIDAILAITNYATVNLAALEELDVNPIIVRPAGAGVVAVDALIRLS